MLYALVFAQEATGEVNRLPKALIPLGGAPVLTHQLELLRRVGVTNVVIIAPRDNARVIAEHVPDGSAWGLEVEYVAEEGRIGQANALKRAYASVPVQAEFVMAVKAQALTAQPLRPFVRFHLRRAALATMMLVPLTSPHGVVEVTRSGRILPFAEDRPSRSWANAGFYILSAEFFHRLEDVADHERAALGVLAREGRLFGFRSRAFWRSIDSVREAAEAERHLADLGLASLPSLSESLLTDARRVAGTDLRH